MKDYEARRPFVLTSLAEPDPEEIVRVLQESRAEILMNYLPVRSKQATRFYAECALEARVAFINNIPCIHRQRSGLGQTF